MLLAAVADPWPAIAFGCAAVKFVLIAGGLIYAAAGGIAWLAGRLRPN
jgi:hypothetical protein